MTEVNTLAEQGILASIFNTPEDLSLATTLLTPEDFNEPRHEAIFSTMLHLANEGKGYGLVNLAGYLSQEGQLAQVGGVEYLISLMNPEALYAYEADIIGYALLVKEASQKRQVNRTGEEILNLTREGSGYTASQILNQAEERIRYASDLIVKSEAVKADSFIDDLLTTIKDRESIPEGGVSGVPSGFIDLDRATMGWKPGQMIIIAGRPGMGKTTLALDCARAASLKAGMTTLFFSLEMSKEEIMEKLISAENNIEGNRLKRGELDSSDWDNIHEFKKLMLNSNLIFDDSPKIDLAHIRAVCERQRNKPEGLDVIFIDYLQLMGSDKKVESRQQEVSQISRSVKLLAKELGIPIIILSQLNRGSEKRSDMTPMPSDLRESGSLEQDADIILLIHRPEYYDANDRPGQALLDIAKHRNGDTKVITLIPLLHYGKFANSSGIIAPYAPSEEEPPETDEPPIFDPDDTYLPTEPDRDTPYEDPETNAPAW